MYCGFLWGSPLSRRTSAVRYLTGIMKTLFVGSKSGYAKQRLRVHAADLYFLAPGASGFR
jgi:hypothetical protein